MLLACGATCKPALVCAQAVLRSEPRHFYLCHAGVAYMHLKKYHSAIAPLQTALDMVDLLYYTASLQHTFRCYNI